VSDVLLTEEQALKALRDFFHEPPFVFFGTGMSCALDSKFGMSGLKNALVEKLKKPKLSSQLQAEWNSVIKTLKKTNDLESALDSVSNSKLLKRIVSETRRFISSLDKNYSQKIFDGKSVWPAIGIIKRIYDGLPELAPILNVLTPNYDMLFEYACVASGIVYTDGFIGGVVRQQDWKSAENSLLEPQQNSYRVKKRTVYKTKKHICLFKVHGSLNYFYFNNHLISNDAWLKNPPRSAECVLVTPGLSKYQKLQQFRQELIQPADTAIDKASRFLFLGYGFNDSHLEVYIRRKLVDQSCHGIIITKDSNTRIEKLLSESPNLWLVCRLSGMDGTCIKNRRYSTPLTLNGKKVWNIQEFEKYVFGG